MNYIKHYILLIRKAKTRDYEEIKNEYTENHHYFPISLYKENELTVKLTAYEHIMAHLLLFKFCEKRYGLHHYKTNKMLHAFRMMTFANKEKRKPSLRMISKARELNSISNVGENNPAKRKEVRQKISLSKKGKERYDLKGKKYFGAKPEAIAIGIKKMADKKRGKCIEQKHNYDRPPCSKEKAKKISESRLKTTEKYIKMTKKEFKKWLLDISEGGKIFLSVSIEPTYKFNQNITNAIKSRNEKELTLKYQEFVLNHIRKITFDYLLGKYQIRSRVLKRFNLIQNQISMINAYNRGYYEIHKLF